MEYGFSAMPILGISPFACLLNQTRKNRRFFLFRVSGLVLRIFGDRLRNAGNSNRDSEAVKGTSRRLIQTLIVCYDRSSLMAYLQKDLRFAVVSTQSNHVA